MTCEFSNRWLKDIASPALQWDKKAHPTVFMGEGWVRQSISTWKIKSKCIAHFLNKVSFTRFALNCILNWIKTQSKRYCACFEEQSVIVSLYSQSLLVWCWPEVFPADNCVTFLVPNYFGCSPVTSYQLFDIRENSSCDIPLRPSSFLAVAHHLGWFGLF